MNQQNTAGAVTSQEDLQAAKHMYEIFSFLAQNPQQYAQVRQFMIDGDQIDPEDLPEQMAPEQIAAAANEFAAAAQSGQMPEQAGIAGQFAGPAQMPAPGVADELAKYGRNGDTMLAHVTPQEAQMLKMMGGAGTINPTTGLPEYFSLKKALKRITKPIVGAVVGAATGFLVGGPVGAVVGGVTGAAAGEQSYQASKATNQAARASAEEQRLAQEFENNRIAEARAEAERVRQAEIRRQENIAAGQGEIASAFGQFDDNFYNRRMQSYMDYAQPQLDKQYEDQVRSLTASLARSGNLNSSLRAERMAQLQEEYDRGRLTLAEQARGYMDQARSATEAARARLMESNATLADPGTIRASASAEASRLSINPQYANLGTLLSNLSTDVGAGGQRTISQNTGGVQQYNTGLSTSAGRLVQ